jgi:hypothetical protein
MSFTLVTLVWLSLRNQNSTAAARPGKPERRINIFRAAIDIHKAAAAIGPVHKDAAIVKIHFSPAGENRSANSRAYPR